MQQVEQFRWMPKRVKRFRLPLDHLKLPADARFANAAIVNGQLQVKIESESFDPVGEGDLIPLHGES